MTKEEEAINVLGALDFPCEHCPMNSTCTEKGTYLCTDAFQTAAVAIHEKMERKNYGDEPEGRLNAICEQCQIDYSDRLFLHELLRAYENENERENPKPLTLDELKDMWEADWVWVTFPELSPKDSGWYKAEQVCKLYSHEQYGKTWVAYCSELKEL
jgi:hypothetical protein